MILEVTDVVYDSLSTSGNQLEPRIHSCQTYTSKSPTAESLTSPYEDSVSAWKLNNRKLCFSQMFARRAAPRLVPALVGL